MSFFLIITLVSLAVGFVIGRWWAAIPCIAMLGIFYLGLNTGWWGNGVGDGWYFVMLFAMVFAAAGAATGAWIRRSITRDGGAQ